MEKQEKIERIDNTNEAIIGAKTAALAITLAIKEKFRDNKIAERKEFWELIWDNVCYINQHIETIEVETTMLFKELPSGPPCGGAANGSS